MLPWPPPPHPTRLPLIPRTKTVNKLAVVLDILERNIASLSRKLRFDGIRLAVSVWVYILLDEPRD